MKRITFWLLSTVSVIVLLFGYDGSTSATTPTAVPPGAVSSGSSSTTGTSSGGSSAKTTTITGGVASTRWGPVQVQLTVSGGKITKVTVVQQPTGNPKDVEINNLALPILIKETTSSQSASIDMVSGATVTSTGYIQSLQSALDSADL